MTHLIYQLTNRITGKAYVGQTKDLPSRLSAHKYCAGGCRYLHNAIRKYGWDAFDCVVLKSDLTKAQVCAEEGRQIVLQNTLAPNGYNLSIDSAETREFSEETLVLKSHSSQRRETKPGPYGYIGVVKSGSRVGMQLRYRGQWVGAPFDTVLEAAEAYDRVALHLHGPSARINFIDSLESYLKEDLKAFYEGIREKDEKDEKTSRFEYVCWHSRHQRWMAYHPLERGGYKSLGLHHTEEEAHAAVTLYKDKGEYTRSKPSEWKKACPFRKALSRSRHLYTVRGPDGTRFETASLRALSEHIGIDWKSLWVACKEKRPTKRPVPGWEVTDTQPLTEERRAIFRASSPLCLWIQLAR